MQVNCACVRINAHTLQLACLSKLHFLLSFSFNNRQSLSSPVHNEAATTQNMSAALVASVNMSFKSLHLLPCQLSR